MNERAPDCMRDQCHAHGEFYPVLIVHRETDHVRAIVGLVVCGMCRPKIKKPTDVLAQNEILKLTTALRGERVTVDWIRFNCAEAKTFRRVNQKRN